jgi:O-antigen ligase
MSFIPQALGVMVVAFALLDMIHDLRIDVPVEIGLYSLLGLFVVITFFLIPDPSHQGASRIGSFVKVVVATLACAQLIKDESDFFTSLKVFSLSILFIFAQNAGDLQSLSRSATFSEEDRFAGTMTNANIAAIFALTVIWACGLLLMNAQPGWLRRVFYGLPIGIGLVIIYFSGSKKALFGLGLFVLFFARLLYIRRGVSAAGKRWVLLAALALIALAGYVIVASPFFFRVEQMVQGVSISDMRRLAMAKEAVGVWLMSPRTFLIGVGYENFRLYSSQMGYSHSTPLELLACNGLIGFSLFMAFLFLLIRRFIRLYRGAADAALKSNVFSILIFLTIFVFFMAAAILHDSRELLPILGILAAYGQFATNRQWSMEKPGDTASPARGPGS